MARHKDVDWSLPDGGPNGHSYDSIKVSLLMDIRDELQRLNALLHCHNFTTLPAAVRSIRRAMPAKRKAAKKIGAKA